MTSLKQILLISLGTVGISLVVAGGISEYKAIRDLRKYDVNTQSYSEAQDDFVRSSSIVMTGAALASLGSRFYKKTLRN